MAKFHGDSQSAQVDRLQIMSAAVAGYPRAKRFVIAGGRSASEVEAMPVAQVVLLYTMQTYDELCDNITKWAFVPYAQHKHSDGFPSGREIIPVAGTFISGVWAARSAEGASGPWHRRASDPGSDADLRGSAQRPVARQIGRHP